MDAIIVKDYYGANEVGRVTLDAAGSVKVGGQLQSQLQDIVDRIMSQQPIRTADAVLKHGMEWGAERDFVPGQDSLLLAIFYNKHRFPVPEINGKPVCYLYAPDASLL
ncbi:hypothetical protein HYV82_03035 [Candidatus Woesearchaeota archaeon]|nr:hypothetical protein [Candidatus Woesearchaeota archaeon]